MSHKASLTFNFPTKFNWGSNRVKPHRMPDTGNLMVTQAVYEFERPMQSQIQEIVEWLSTTYGKRANIIKKGGWNYSIQAIHPTASSFHLDGRYKTIVGDVGGERPEYSFKHVVRIIMCEETIAPMFVLRYGDE